MGETKPFSAFLGKAAFILSCLWLTLIVITALVAPWLPLHPPDLMNWDRMLEPPILFGQSLTEESHYWLGTDTTGRDLLSRVLFGARVSLVVGSVCSLIGLLIGGTLGVIAGYARGRLGVLIVDCMDIVLAFPGLVLLLAVSFYFGAGLSSIIPALSILISPYFFRVARANTLRVVDREYVVAARILGQSDFSILIFEILPNIIAPLTVYSVLMMAVLIVFEGTMSFLGLSVSAPQASWGGMIAEGREVLFQAPHLCLVPAFVLFCTVLSLNILGESLRDLAGIGEAQS